MLPTCQPRNMQRAPLWEVRKGHFPTYRVHKYPNEACGSRYKQIRHNKSANAWPAYWVDCWKRRSNSPYRRYACNRRLSTYRNKVHPQSCHRQPSNMKYLASLYPKGSKWPHHPPMHRRHFPMPPKSAKDCPGLP